MIFGTTPNMALCLHDNMPSMMKQSSDLQFPIRSHCVSRDQRKIKHEARAKTFLLIPDRASAQRPELPFHGAPRPLAWSLLSRADRRERSRKEQIPSE